MPRFGSLLRERERTDKQTTLQDEDRLARQSVMANDTSLGQLMRGMGAVNEPPARSDEELNARAQRNAGFLQQPEIQAAMLQFAINIMQPLGSGADWGDFAGALGGAIGGGVQAAGNYQLVQGEEYEQLRKADIEERETRVKEGQLSLAERNLEKELEAGTMKQRSLVINGNSPINDMYKLGLKPGEKAKVEVTYDLNGNIVNADLEDLIGGDDPTESNVAKLQREADEAEARGEIDKANQLRQAALKEASGENALDVAKGVQLIPDPNAPGGLRAVDIPGGESEQKKLEAKEADVLQKKAQIGKAQVINQTVDSIHQTVANSIAPEILITGGIGGLSALMPHPTDARMVEQWLEVIRANVGFDELQKMRDASEHGGALGQVAIQENLWLQSVQGSLQRTQKPAELIRQLLTIKYLYDPSKLNWRANLSRAVENKTMEASEALAAMQTDLMQFIYPELKPEPLDWNNPPEYLSEEDKRLWHRYDNHEKFLFFDEKDRNRIMGGF